MAVPFRNVRGVGNNRCTEIDCDLCDSSPRFPGRRFARPIFENHRSIVQEARNTYRHYVQLLNRHSYTNQLLPDVKRRDKSRDYPREETMKAPWKER